MELRETERRILREQGLIGDSRPLSPDQPDQVGVINLHQHVATGGLVNVYDHHDSPHEPAGFGDFQNAIHNQAIQNDPNYSSNSFIGGGGDGAGTEQENLIIGDDNPILPPGPNRTTVGVEFELWLAVSRSLPGLQDPHPNDGRWQSQNLVTEEEEDARFRLSMRNLVIDTLRQNGLAASKTREREIYTDTNREGWLFDLNDGRLCPNRPILHLWQPHYQWNYEISLQDNCISAATTMANQFLEFHWGNGLDLHRTWNTTIDEFSYMRLPYFINGLDYALQPDPNGSINEAIGRLWIQHIDRARSLLEAQEGRHVDENCVQLPGADPKYYAWTCSVDRSIAVEPILPYHYKIPDGSILPPADPALDPDLIPQPPALYKWWPGELKSPIYDYDNPATLQMIRNACAALRNTYRIHKPMSTVGTGLHIHFGQEKGWTLLQVKKFTTLWFLMEESLETLHRVERSMGNTFGLPLRDSCPVSHALFRGPAIRRQYSEFLPDIMNRNPQRHQQYIELMQMHVPLDLPAEVENFTPEMRLLIEKVWLYDTLSALTDGMTGFNDYSCITYRLRGNKVTGTLQEAFQTLEVRLMQGTLDADHIWRWMTICQRLIIFSRDSTPQQYYNGVRDMLMGTQHPANILNVPMEYMTWLDDRKNQFGYFEYPDHDVVNWEQPFMVPGFADVYTGLSEL